MHVVSDLQRGLPRVLPPPYEHAARDESTSPPLESGLSCDLLWPIICGGRDILTLLSPGLSNNDSFCLLPLGHQPPCSKTDHPVGKKPKPSHYVARKTKLGT